MNNQPSALDTGLYRRTMGLFATGVTVLLTRTAKGEPIGMTANSLTSVSLNPLMLLVCVAKNANIVEHLLNAEWFSISILCEEQAALSDYFAGIYAGAEPPEFTFEDWNGGLRIINAAGAIGCKRGEVIEGGDHWIVLGEVMAIHRRDDPPDPLIFYAGKYRQLAEWEQDHQ